MHQTENDLRIQENVNGLFPFDAGKNMAIKKL